jgi:hypothetical protein
MFPSRVRPIVWYPSARIWGKKRAIIPSAQGRFGPVGDFHLIEIILENIQCTGEQNRHYPDNDTHNHIERDFPGRHQRITGHFKSRVVAQKSPDDHGRDNGRNQYRGESPDCIIAQDNFHGEQNTGKRGVKDSRDTGRRTAADKNFDPVTGHVQHLSYSRTDRRTDLDNRPLTSGHPGADNTTETSNRVHDFRHPVTFGLEREFEYYRSHQQAADHRYQRQIELVPAGTGPPHRLSENLVAQTEKDMIEILYQGDKTESAESRRQTNHY